MHFPGMTRILLSCRSQEQKRAHINPSRADGSPSTLKIGPREDGLGLCWPHGEGHRRIHTPGIPECPESLPNFLHRGAPVPNPCFRRSSVTLRFTSQASGPQTQSYLLGVRFLHIVEGKGNPFETPLSRLEYVLKGVKWEEVQAGSQTQVRAPQS